MKMKMNYQKIMFLILLVYLSYSLFSQNQTMNRISAESKTQKVLLEKLKQDNSNLQDDVALTKTDKYQENIARQILNLIKEGETPVKDSGKK